ncbi:MAG: DnaJ domain-containing protein [Polyangiaceae bacterium]|jgi:tetratricopeptide (TPR) repeat protein
MTDPKNPQPGASLGDSGSDLPPEVAARIDAVHQRVGSGTIDHFALLGLPRSATRAQVRQAFLALAPQFHPDKYFGRKLGPYAAKMQRVFAALSVAHDTLVNDERRAEYSEGLPPELPSTPSPAQAPVAPPARVAKDTDPVTMELEPQVTRTPTMSAADARARQQAFAAKLAGHSSSRMRAGTPVAPFKASASSPPAKPQTDAPRRMSSGGMHAVDPKAAVDALRRRYEDSVAHARGKQSQDLVHAAEEAVAKGDFSTALQLYRSATSHNSNPALKAVLAETETKAKMQLHATAQDRAREAEQKQDYGDAGANWARAFDLVPSAETAQRASLCFRRAGTDPRRAAKYGEEAVKLDPHKASYRVNLALVYCDLGMALRARGEIERAHAIEPQNPQVKEAFARVKAMK